MAAFKSSLDAINEITEQAATFRSHVDGAQIRLTPEHSIEIQESLGSDVVMVLDHVIALPAERGKVEEAMARSVRWARRCLEAATRVPIRPILRSYKVVWMWISACNVRASCQR